MAKILLVEDDTALNAGIGIALRKDAHEVTGAFGFIEALNAYRCSEFDLLLLDINLPDGNGLELCRHIRNESDIPVVFITANDTEPEMLTGFNAGCDDYIAKPFSVEVLRSRVSALLRRTIAKSVNVIEYKGLRLDCDSMSVTVDGELCKLTATEYRLLEYLAQNKGKVITRDSLLSGIWDADGSFIDENTLSVHIKRLRGKLEKDAHNPEYIKTVFGIGYVFGG